MNTYFNDSGKSYPSIISNSILQKKELNNHTIRQSPPNTVQPELSIGSHDSVYEREADAMANKVMHMQMPEPINFSSGKNSAQRKCAHCEGVERQLQKKENSPVESSTIAPQIVHDVVGSSPGKSLDEGARSFMEPRFGYDFSRIRIHDNELAAKSASSIHALAYTSGNNVVFNSGQYDPGSDSGKKLLAHELTHVMQQNGSSAETDAKRQIMRSPVSTFYGNFKDESYTTLKDAANKEIGVEMYMKFTPNANVDAKMIGLTQTSRSIDSGSVRYLNNTVRDRSITSADAKTISSPTLGKDEGIHIDHLSNSRSPLYAADVTGGTDTKLSQGATPMHVTRLTTPGASGSLYDGWGEHGYRYMDGPNLKQKDAELHDTPALPPPSNNSEQLFETTALAIDGAQNGAYYGSVEWGWRIDGRGNFSKIPFSFKSNGAPTSTFLKAAEKWNNTKTSSNQTTLPLPTIDVYLVSKTGGVILNDGLTGPYRSDLLPKGTRVKIMSRAYVGVLPAAEYVGKVEVIVVDGSNALMGAAGWVPLTALTDERN